MAKGALFYLPRYIDSSAAIIFRELDHEDCLRGLSRDAFVGRSRLLPGRGRTPCTRSARATGGRSGPSSRSSPAAPGLQLAWQHSDAARNIEASAAIMRGDPGTDAEDARRARHGRHLTTRDQPF